MSSNLNSSCCSGHPLSPLFSSDRAPLFFYRIGLPLPPTPLEAPGPGLVSGESQRKGHQATCSFLPAAAACFARFLWHEPWRLPGGCSAWETCLRAQQVILVPASLGDDLIFQDAQPPSPQASQKPSLPGKGERETGPQRYLPQGQARPGHWIPRRH